MCRLALRGTRAIFHLCARNLVRVILVVQTVAMYCKGTKLACCRVDAQSDVYLLQPEPPAFGSAAGREVECRNLAVEVMLRYLIEMCIVE